MGVVAGLEVEDSAALVGVRMIRGVVGVVDCLEVEDSAEPGELVGVRRTRGLAAGVVAGLEVEG